MQIMARETRAGFARAFSAVVLAHFLAACASEARQTFDFDGSEPKSRFLQVKYSAAIDVSEPTAIGLATGDRIVVRQSDDSLSVLPGVQWSDRLPRLLQRRLIDVLQDAGVAAGASGGGATYRLATDLRRFEIDVARSLAVTEVSVRLINDASGKERAAAILVADYPAPEHTGAPGVRALAQAADEAARKVAQWVRRSL